VTHWVPAATVSNNTGMSVNGDVNIHGADTRIGR